MQASGKPFNPRWMFWLGVTLLFLFIVFGAFTALVYSRLGRSFLMSSLNKALQESGWQFSAQNITGSLSEDITFSEALITSHSGDTLQIHSLKVRIAPLRLLNKELVFRHFNANGVLWKPASSFQMGPNIQKVRTFPLRLIENESPYTFYFPHFEIKNLTIPSEHEESFDLSGTLKVNKRSGSIYARVFAKTSWLEASVLFFKNPNQEAQLKVDSKLLSLEPLFSRFSVPSSGNATTHVYMKGSWEAFKGNGPLKGVIDVTGHLEDAFVIPANNWTLLTSFHYEPNGTLSFPRLSLKSSLLQAQGKLVVKDRNLIGASVRISVEEMKRWHFASLEGPLSVRFVLKGGHVQCSLSSPHTKAGPLSMDGLEGVVTLDRENELWSGTATMDGSLCAHPWNAKTLLSISPSEKSLQFNDGTFNSSLATASGSLSIVQNAPLQGEWTLSIDDLHKFSSCTAPEKIYGSLTAQCTLKGSSVQETDLTVQLSQFFYNNIKIEKTSFVCSLFGSLLGSVHGEILEGQWNSLFVNKGFLNGEWREQEWVWDLSSCGEWGRPYELTMSGSAAKKEGEWHILAKDLSGELLAHPLSIPSPIRIAYSSSRMLLAPSQIQIGSGTIQGSFERKEEETSATLSCEKVPLALFSANPLDVEIEGLVHLKGALATVQKTTTGSLSASLSKVLIASDQEEPLALSAHIEATLSQDHLLFNTETSIRGTPLMRCQGTMPIRVDLNQPLFEPLLSDPISVSFSFDGAIEEVLDFFNLGPNRLEGLCSATFSLTNTLTHPKISGSLSLKEGRYENYFTGTELRDIEASLSGKNSTIQLRSFSAKDGFKHGIISGEGELSLLYRDHFPFRLEGTFSRITAINTEWVQADVDGTIRLTGNMDRVLISGKAIIAEADVSIPEKIPVPRPELVVKYLHAPERESSRQVKKPPTLFLDYVVEAPDGIFISGRGLSSEWKGSVVLTGPATQIEMNGRYDVLSGHFDCAGRRFTLNEGSLSFGGKPRSFPYLTLEAQAEVQNVSVIASLKGPLNNPLLSLYSSPSLPTGVILSYLLFDEDLAELNAFQAAQLMTSLESLSQDNSLVERTRKALNVDRLRIIATPIDDEGGKTYSLQVGKYVTKNVLLSVSQGTQDDSTNLSVELTLGNGWIFQAESQREVEQGKFTLKWNVNY